MDLVEMPRLLGGKLDNGEWGTFYHSHDTLKRRFDHLFSSKIGTDIIDFFRSKFSKDQYIGTIPSEDDPNRDEVIFRLTFRQKPTLYVIPPEINDRKVLQVAKVMTHPSFMGSGISSFVYSYLAEDGTVVMSDIDQYQDGAKLWKRIAQIQNRHVYLIINNQDFFKDDDGIPIEYDSGNIDDEFIWSHQGNYKGQHTILCLTKEKVYATSN